MRQVAQIWRRAEKVRRREVGEATTAEGGGAAAGGAMARVGGGEMQCGGSKYGAIRSPAAVRRCRRRGRRRGAAVATSPARAATATPAWAGTARAPTRAWA
ncbi:hypothetical protein ACP4OV_013038 [Aristida adscensionis]